MMNRNWLTRVLAGLMLTMSSTIVLAADENTDKDKPSSTQTIVVIGSDGKVLSADGSLDALPKEVRDRIKQFTEQLQESPANANDLKKIALDSISAQLIPAGQPSGDLAGSMLHFSSKGSVIVFSPDGKTFRREFELGQDDEDAESLRKIVVEALGRDGELSDKVMQVVSGTMKTERQVKNANPIGSKLDAVLEKFDSVLERLDRLESEISKIKKDN